MNILTPAQISTIVDEEFASTVALPKAIRVAPRPLGENSAIRTDVYVGPKGSGFVVVGTMKIGTMTFARSRQQGPETTRERDWDKPGILKTLETNYNKLRNTGLAVGGITFAAQDSDMAKLSQLVTLLREAEELQPDDAAKEAFRASQTTLVDINNVVHSVTVTEARQLIVQYGQAIQAMWATYADQRALMN